MTLPELPKVHPGPIALERERCCVDICPWCRKVLDEPHIVALARRRDGHVEFTHTLPAKDTYVYCDASPIRERVEREGLADGQGFKETDNG